MVALIILTLKLGQIANAMYVCLLLAFSSSLQMWLTLAKNVVAEVSKGTATARVS